MQNQKFWMVFCFFAVVVSLFHGVYAVTIWFRGPNLKDAREEIQCRDSWSQGWKDIFRHPAYLYQCWFNFAGSALGWAALGYAIWRLSTKPDRFGLAEAGLLLVGAIGITGYLPNMLHRIVGAAESFVDAAKKLAGGK